MAAGMLISEARDERRLWHKVTSIGPIPRAGKASKRRRFHLLCSYQPRYGRLGGLGGPALADGTGFLDDYGDFVGRGLLVTAAEPVDAEGTPRAHSPVKAKVQLCQICFAAGTPVSASD